MNLLQQLPALASSCMNVHLSRFSVKLGLATGLQLSTTGLSQAYAQWGPIHACMHDLYEV